MDVTTIGGLIESNIGGIASSVVLVPVDAIVSSTRQQIVCTKAYRIYFTDGTGKHDEQQKNGKNGTSFEQKISFVVPKNRADVREWLTNNCRKFFLVQFTDKNGEFSEITRAELKSTRTTGATPTNRNEAVFTFEGNTIQPAQQARILVAPAIIAVSPASFDFGIVKIGKTKQLSYTIANTGGQTLVVQSTDAPAAYGVDWTTGNVLPTESQEATITFSPTQALTYTGNIGIVSNAVESPKYVPVTGVGFMDMGLRLNRIAQYARAPYNPATSVATNSPHSYSIMFKTAAIDNGQPNYLWHHEGYNSGMATYGNEFYFSKSNAGGGIFDQVKVTSAIQPNTLYHVVVVNTGLGASGIKVYINGIERTPIILNNNGATGTPTGALVIGVYIGGPYFYFGGVIYHFRKFNVALTPSQVQEEYSTGFIPAELAGNTIAQYEIQEDESQYEILVEQKHNNHATLMGYTPIEIQFSRTDINGN